MATEWRNGGVRPSEIRDHLCECGYRRDRFDIGAHRVKEHLLSKKPDFVVVEYSVTDPNDPKSGKWKR